MKEIEVLEQETLFILVNSVLYEYDPKKLVKPHVKAFLRKSLNFRNKIEIF